jgi:hypothetical protein
MADITDTEKRTAWQAFIRSPLAVFAGVFSTLEAVVLAFLTASANPVEPVDALVVIMLTVALFVLVVLARPQALYPPSEWKQPAPAPDALIALIVLSIFIVCIGGGWAMKFAGPEWAKIIHGSSAATSVAPTAG